MYASVQDLIARFGQRELIQLTNGPEDPGTAVIAAPAELALTDASSTIDGYLRSRYRLPLAAVPQRLVGLACDIARFGLMHGEGKIPTDQAKDAHDRAIAFLRDVAKGVADLGLDAAGSPAPETEGARFGGSGRLFSRDSLRGL